jgi:hypothetical protein
MINDLDETIRQILVKGGKLDPAEVEISFDIPNREWSSGISKPSVNCYLFDIRENRELRQYGVDTTPNPGQNKFTRQRPPMRFDLTYLVTAWTRAVEDEHRLLWHALQTLTRYETMPMEFLQGDLRETGYPIHARTALPDSVLKSPGEFWTALENQLKPSLSYIVTLALNRELLTAGPPVQTNLIRFPWPGGVDQRFTWFGGVVRNAAGEPIANTTVEIEHRGIQVTTDALGRFRLRVPGPGNYTLVTQVGGKTQRRTIEIPEPTYDIEIP